MRIQLLSLGSVLLLLGCQGTPAPAPSLDEPEVSLVAPDGTELALKVEIADEPGEQAQGLMFRTDLPEGTGMLFTYPTPQVLQFWMKNTLIPLDILFFDAQNRLVTTQTMDPCHLDPCPTYSSIKEVISALEVPAGFVQKHSIKEGWILREP